MDGVGDSPRSLCTGVEAADALLDERCAAGSNSKEVVFLGGCGIHPGALGKACMPGWWDACILAWWKPFQTASNLGWARNFAACAQARDPADDAWGGNIESSDEIFEARRRVFGTVTRASWFMKDAWSLRIQSIEALFGRRSAGCTMQALEVILAKRRGLREICSGNSVFKVSAQEHTTLRLCSNFNQCSSDAFFFASKGGG
jgi:hypothetical protein